MISQLRVGARIGYQVKVFLTPKLSHTGYSPKSEKKNVNKNLKFQRTNKKITYRYEEHSY